MSTMTEDKFEELASIYGGNIAFWPEEDQTAAGALLARSPAAQAALKAEQALDAALGDWKAPAPSDALMARILGDAAEVSAERAVAAEVAPAPAEKPGIFSRLFGDMNWRPVGAMAACLAVGFVVGMSDAPSSLGDNAQEMALIEADNAVVAAFFDDDLESDPFDVGTL